METLVFVAFVCPHCGRKLSRNIHIETVRAHVVYECVEKLGGCGQLFELLYLRDQGVQTRPPQPCFTGHIFGVS